MASTIKIKSKIDKIDLIKTVCSHGWQIREVLLDKKGIEGMQKFLKDKKSVKINNYIIETAMNNEFIFVTYQPDSNEITIISRNNAVEKRFKKPISKIFEQKILGKAAKDRGEFEQNLVDHDIYLSPIEKEQIINDVFNTDSLLGYV